MGQGKTKAASGLLGLPLKGEGGQHQGGPPLWKAVYVHFESQEDVDEFSRLLGQRIYRSTRVIWFPEITAEELLGEKAKK